MNRAFQDSKKNSFVFVDGDTIANTKGERLRIGNLNAREVDKIVTNEEGTKEFKQGQVGGQEQSYAVAKTAIDGGFTEVEYTGKYDNFGRQIINLRNSNGDNLENVLISSGIIEVSPYTSEEAIVAKRERELYEAALGKQEDPANDLGDDINRVIAEQGLIFKDKALNEAYFDPEIHSGVHFRDPGRTLDNQAGGFGDQVAVSWDQGWDGVKEGLWGYTEALGQTTGIELLENLGTAGVRNARRRMADAPEVVLDYQEVDDVWTGFNWAMNNAAMSAPYLVATFGAAAAAVPAAAIAGPIVGGITAIAPIASIYAGHTWNEMEGEKGVPQFLAATTTGVAAAMVERLGMKALIKAPDILSSTGMNRLVDAYAKKNKISRTLAKDIVLKTAKQEQASMARSLLRMKPSDIAKFSGMGVLKQGAMGTLTEAGTEVIQEGLQAATVAAMSDKEYTQDELVNRFINAGLAGGVIGGSFSSAGNIYSQGKLRLQATDYGKANTDRYRVIERAAIADKRNNSIKQPSTVAKNIQDDDANGARNNFDYEDNKEHFNNLAQQHENEKRGLKNFVRNNDDLSDYIESITTGLGRLVKSAEASAIDFNKLVKSKVGLDIFARIGQVTTGVYHAGMNFKQYNDQLISDFKSYVNETAIANLFDFKTLNSKNAIEISKQIREFGRSGGYEAYELMSLQQEGAYDLANDYVNATDPVIKQELLDALAELGLLNDAEIRGYLRKANQYPNGIVPFEALNVDSVEQAGKLYAAAKQIKNSYDAAYTAVNEQYRAATGQSLTYNENYWWRHQGFDWKKVKKDPAGFKAWLKGVDSSLDVDAIYQNITQRGQSGTQGDFSLVGGTKFRPWSFSDSSVNIVESKGFNQWSNDNLFETLNKSQAEAAKYTSTTLYFGEGGSKLSKLFKDLEAEQQEVGDLTPEDIQQFAWYAKAIIDSAHGNFRRIQNPRWAAVNSYLTSWSIFAGLPLSTISSLPETAMIYFKVKDNEEWRQATARLVQEIGSAWDDTLKKEVEISRKQLEQSGMSEDVNTVVDRLATGERDVSFIKAHEAFFRSVGIKQFTQFQRRMNAAFAIDTVKAGFNRLEFAPTRKEKDENGRDIEVFDLENFNEVEMRTYLDLSDLGMDVQKIYNYFKDLDEIYRDGMFDMDKRSPDEMEAYIKEPTLKEMATRKLARQQGTKGDALLQRAEEIQSEIEEAMQTVVYRFVNERIQNPQSANRPLFFQDPHYQLFTQFNGFISTYTANVVPKLWRDMLAKGNPKLKYDTFALIVLMMGLGASSQYIKDLIKFGKPSPYLDEVGYVQRALYSSGVIGQYERIVDIVHPLYPQRGDGLEWLFNTVLGEAGPSARNIETLLTAAGQALSGETERAAANALKVAPYLGPITSARRAGSDIIHLENPLKGKELPKEEDIISFILS
jgi:hypothetical protein